MSELLLPVGMIIVAVTLVDFLTTTISVRREGPVTRMSSRMTSGIVQLFGADSVVGRFQGPIVLVVLAACWISGLWTGWAMVIFAGTGRDGDRFAAGHGLRRFVAVELWGSYLLNVTAVVTASRAMAHRLDLLRKRMDRGDDDGAICFVMHSCEHLLHQATMLAELRWSFPLATFYDLEGSERDVRRAAAAFERELSAFARGGDHVTTIRIEMLHAAVRSLRGDSEREHDN